MDGILLGSERAHWGRAAGGHVVVSISPHRLHEAQEGQAAWRGPPIAIWNWTQRFQAVVEEAMGAKTGHAGGTVPERALDQEGMSVAIEMGGGLGGHPSYSNGGGGSVVVGGPGLEGGSRRVDWAEESRSSPLAVAAGQGVQRKRSLPIALPSTFMPSARDLPGHLPHPGRESAAMPAVICSLNRARQIHFFFRPR